MRGGGGADSIYHHQRRSLCESAQAYGAKFGPTLAARRRRLLFWSIDWPPEVACSLMFGVIDFPCKTVTHFQRRATSGCRRAPTRVPLDR